MSEPDGNRKRPRCCESCWTPNRIICEYRRGWRKCWWPSESRRGGRGLPGGGEQVHRRGDHIEAVRYSDVALKIRPNDVPASTLKARALAALGRRSDAETVLSGLPELEGGGEAADLLLDFYLEGSDSKALERWP